mmetsp:Transcript_60844/g.196021  ORF Transcript_60844/g.196021 Transcript_60844/m.196021 type:complete len:201 (+) Transcript_60844:372-974(+)
MITWLQTLHRLEPENSTPVQFDASRQRWRQSSSVATPTWMVRPDPEARAAGMPRHSRLIPPSTGWNKSPCLNVLAAREPRGLKSCAARNEDAVWPLDLKMSRPVAPPAKKSPLQTTARAAMLTGLQRVCSWVPSIPSETTNACCSNACKCSHLASGCPSSEASGKPWLGGWFCLGAWSRNDDWQRLGSRAGTICTSNLKC